MQLIACQILTSINAKVMPTANASMLVAMASSIIFLNPNEPSVVSSSLEKDSLIILPPISANKKSATQWSMAVI